MDECGSDSLDRFEAARFTPGSDLPEGVRAGVRRRRQARRARRAGGVALALGALVGGAGFLRAGSGRPPGTNTRLATDGLLLVDDPVFDALGVAGHGPRASERWRAGNRRWRDLDIEM